LVWCHEHCHKEALKPLRSRFSEAAQHAGGKLYCLKKAAGFKMWSQQAACRFFVLLVDWREAKQCGEFLLRDSKMPHSLVVYTQSDKGYTQALRWSTSLQMQGYSWQVHVLPPSFSGEELAVYAASLLQNTGDFESLAGSSDGMSSPLAIRAALETPLASSSPPGSPRFVTGVAIDPKLVQEMQDLWFGSSVAARREEGGAVEDEGLVFGAGAAGHPRTFGSVREKHNVDHGLALAGGHFCPLDHFAVFPNFVQ